MSMGLPAGADLGLGELEGDDVGEFAHRVPPPVDHLVQPRVPDLGAEQVDDHGRDMGPPDSWASSLRLYWTPTLRTRLRPSG